jgi:pyruvate dehydrogenase E1 component beta subunit
VALYAAQHNNSVEAWFAHVPGLLVAMPATPRDAKGLLKSALRGADPVLFLMHKRLSGVRGEVGGADEIVPFGVADVARPGRDLTIVAWSGMVPRALAAADELSSKGIGAEVIDLRTIVPLDTEMLEASVRRTRRVLVVTEEPRFASFAAEVVAHLHERVGREMAAPAVRLGALHAPVAHSPALIEHVIPQVDEIVDRAAALVVA